MSKASNALSGKIAGAVAEAVASDKVNADASAIAPITEAVAKQVVPEILHATNNEPFLRSWVATGSSASVIGALYLFGYTIWKTGDLPSSEIAVPALLVIYGGLQALYGRYRAKKPIGA